MRIAILGTRGIPASYGGFETFAEELAPRLIARGHEVTVYCRSHHTEKSLTTYKGVRLVVLPTIRHKYLDTVIHTLISSVNAVFKRFDAVIMCNAANSPLIPILTWTGTPVAINVDGLERNRDKWNRLGKLYYRLGERASVWFADQIITDARVIQDYYRSEYDKDSTMIAYGAELGRRATPDVPRRYGAEPEGYFLYLARLEPENNALMVIEAFRRVDTAKKLLIVGDAPYADEYKSQLREAAGDDPRIIFTGYVFGSDRKALQQNAFAYVHATKVGGTHPALIEAMAARNCVLTFNTPENAEVVGDAALIYANADELAEQLRLVEAKPEVHRCYREAAEARAAAHYDWEQVANAYADLCSELVTRS